MEKTWKGTQYLLFDRRVTSGFEELCTFVILSSCFSTCLEKMKLEDHLWRTVAEWKNLCTTPYAEDYFCILNGESLCAQEHEELISSASLVSLHNSTVNSFDALSQVGCCVS